MAKRKLSQNRKIYLDKGYLTHLTIKWKDVTKNEQARATVMGMYEGKLDIPFTLMLIGHKQEILKEVTQNGILEKGGASAICKFQIKSILGKFKEEDVAEITVKIEMNDQRLDVPSDDGWLRIGTTCLERFHEACNQNDATKHPSEKDTYFKWVSNNNTPSKIQNAEAVQDQFNFGSGAYGADPEVFEFIVNMDIGKQIGDSMRDVGVKKKGDIGAMHKAYNDALRQRGKPIDFVWLKEGEDKAIPFGKNAFKNIKNKAWPFGRTSATLKKDTGKITVCDDGRYFVEGVLEFESDYYSWVADAQGNFIEKAIKNEGFRTLGRNINSPGQGNWKHASPASEDFLGDTEPSMGEHEWFGKKSKGSVQWNKASEAYNKGNPAIDDSYGQMPINYTKDYHFYVFGIYKGE
jgi:hypothetical protein